MIDGTEFDSSYKRGEPVVFGCTGESRLDEALQQMKDRLEMAALHPSEKALWRETGCGATSGPNATWFLT